MRKTHQPGIPCCDTVCCCISSAEHIEVVIQAAYPANGTCDCTDFSGTYLVPVTAGNCTASGSLSPAATVDCADGPDGACQMDLTVDLDFSGGLPTLTVEAPLTANACGGAIWILHTNVDAALRQLCSGQCITIPIADWYIDSRCGAWGLSTCAIRLVGSTGECHYPATSYDCVSEVCVRRDDDAGTYATLSDCLSSGCAPPPASYNCIDGTCDDPRDGTGTYATLVDCTDAGCAAPSCFAFNDCVSRTLVAEIASLNDCNDGTYDWLLSNLNGVYFMPLLSGGIYRIDLGTEGDYGDPGILFRRLIVVAGVHEEVYCRGMDISVECVDGRTTIAEIDFYLHSFAWTDPAAPSYVPFSTVAYNPTSSLSGTAVDCTASFMLSVFTFTDCLSASVTFSISATIS